MNDLLNNPAVQGAVAPFLVALVVAALTMRSRLLGLAIAAAFVTVIGLTIGFSFEVMTSMRKMIVLALLAGVLVLLLELGAVAPTWRPRAALALAAAVGGVWLASRVLAQQEAAAAVAGGLAAAAYMAALVESGHAAGRDDTVDQASAALMLGLGTGALAFLGASVTLLQVGLSLGAGAGAALLVQMIAGRRAPSGWTLALPATVTAGAVGVLSVATGTLKAYVLLPMLLVPWAPRLVPRAERPVWLAAVLGALAAAVPAAAAVALAWFGGGSADA